MEVEIEGPAKDSSDPIYRYILRKPTKIEAVTTYTIGALFTGSSTYYGERSMKKFMMQVWILHLKLLRVI